MKVTIAIDSFKGSLSSLEAGNAVKEGILQAIEDAEITVRPLADGGEGTVEALASGFSSQMITLSVTGPLQEPVTAKYCILEDSGTAVMEMAAAAGLPLIPPSRRDPLETTTYGVGEMIRDAIHRGCRKFLIGIGGSATNDGGTGMLTALGYGFLDADNNPIPLGAKGLQALCKIDTQNVIPQLRECRFSIACDVKNPLCGENGCSAVYAPQKGATPESIPVMDNWLKNFAEIAKTVSPIADPDYPGAGAAGGLGFGFLAFTDAVLRPGVQIVLEETRLENAIRDADVVVTGEGRLDGQTVMGKAPIGVAALAKKHGKTVIAFAGSVTPEANLCNDHGIDAFFPVVRGITTLEEAMIPTNAYENLKATANQVFRLLK